jgi:hypothetical protein
MRVELWAVPLSFTCLVVLFGYVTNEAVKLVQNARKKRQTLDRLATAGIHMVNAPGPLVSADPLAGDPCCR